MEVRKKDQERLLPWLVSHRAKRKEIIESPYLTRSNGQSRVQEQDALLGQTSQVAIFGWRETRILVFDFFVDVSERGRELNALSDREGEAVSLIGLVIGTEGYDRRMSMDRAL